MAILNVEVTYVEPEQSARPKTFSRCPEDEDGLYIQITEYNGASHGKHYASESPPYVKLFLSPQDCDSVWGAPTGVDVVHCGESGWPAEAVNSYTVNGITYQMQTPQQMQLSTTGAHGVQAVAP